MTASLLGKENLASEAASLVDLGLKLQQVLSHANTLRRERLADQPDEGCNGEQAGLSLHVPGISWRARPAWEVEFAVMELLERIGLPCTSPTGLHGLTQMCLLSNQRLRILLLCTSDPISSAPARAATVMFVSS